jgi:hypothetical protein
MAVADVVVGVGQRLGIERCLKQAIEDVEIAIVVAVSVVGGK